jgi:hypothetical protein
MARMRVLAVASQENELVDLPDWSDKLSEHAIAPGRPRDDAPRRLPGDPPQAVSQYVARTVIR